MSATDIIQRGVWTNHATGPLDAESDLNTAGHTSPRGRVVGILPVRYASCDDYGCRPVAALDPDDAEQMARLAQEIYDRRGYTGDALASAVRAVMLQPPVLPKPDEPGLWGVVEAAVDDRDGWRREWVRHDGDVSVWTSRAGSSAAWDALIAPVVIRPGITPDEPETEEALPPDLIDAEGDAWRHCDACGGYRVKHDAHGDARRWTYSDVAKSFGPVREVPHGKAALA